MSTIRNQRFGKELDEFISTLEEKELRKEFKEVNM